MTVIPFERAEHGRWRRAITDAASRLSFSLLDASGGLRLVFAVTGNERDEIADSVACALVETDKLVESVAGHVSKLTAPLLIAAVFRSRLVDLMTEVVEPSRSRYAPVTPARASQAYAEALADVLTEILDRDGLKAVKGLTRIGDHRKP